MQYTVSFIQSYLSEQGCSVTVCPDDAKVKQQQVTGLATLAEARPGQITFLANPKYRSLLPASKATACLLQEGDQDAFPGIKLVCNDPYLAFAYLTALFVTKGGPPAEQTASVHPTAVIESDVTLPQRVTIGPGAYVASGVQLGERVVIGANCVIGRGSVLLEDVTLFANVTLYEQVRLGRRVRVHSGAVIGADGFGYAANQGGWVKIHQLGGVQVGDDVEIGAATTIDAGAIDDTIIGNGVIIDNQVQIAHNVIIGDHTAIAGCVGIAGSTKIGQYCTIAGAAGLAGHIEIADRVHIGMQAQVTKSISQPGSYASGTGLLPVQQWRRMVVRLRRLCR